MDITVSGNSRSDKKATEAFKGKVKSQSFNLNGVGAHTLNASRVFPPEIQTALSDLLGRYGVQLDLNQPWVKQLTPENVKAIAQIGEQARRNARFLPEVVAAIKKMALAEVKEAQAKKSIVDVTTCNYKCPNLQSRHFPTRINCNYNYASARIKCN